MNHPCAEYLISVLDDAVREKIISGEQRTKILRRQELSF